MSTANAGITLEAKLIDGLEPYFDEASEVALKKTAYNIAFLLRTYHGPTITPDQISIVFERNPGDPDGWNTLGWDQLSVIFHKTAGKEGLKMSLRQQVYLGQELGQALSEHVQLLAAHMLSGGFAEC